MCYFDTVRCKKIHRLTRRNAIRAWKGFDLSYRSRRLHSPIQNDEWVVGKPYRASEHGFYAVADKPPPHSAAAGHGETVRRVLLWGRVREYRGPYNGGTRHGYLAEFCMILPKRSRS